MKSIAVAIVLLFLVYAGHAQKYGVLAGPSIATFGGCDVVEWGDAFADPKPMIKFHGGVFYEFLVGDNFRVEPRLLYSFKGPRYKGVIGSGDEITYKKQLSYIELPVLGKYYVTKKVVILSGPQLSFLLSAKVINDASDQVLTTYNLEKKEDVKEDYKKVDWAWVFGVGYEVSYKVTILASFDLGVKNIGLVEGYEVGGGTSEYSAGVKNRVVKIGISYRIKE